MQRALICGAGLMAAAMTGMTLADATDVMAKYVITTNEGYRQQFRLYVPDNYDPNRSYPVIMYLSGSGENGTDNTGQLAHINSLINYVSQNDQFSAFVIAPQARPNSGGFQTFTDGRAIPMTMQALDLLGREFNLDSNRFYLTGLSQGGIGTWHTASHYQNTFAAIAPVAGWRVDSAVPNVVNTPTWILQGGSDAVLPASSARAMVSQLQAAGARPLYTEYYGMGHADQTWAKAYGERSLYDWMFNQTLNGPVVTPPPLPPANPDRSFSDTFAGPTLDNKLQDVAGNYVIANGVLRHTDSNGDRTYVRTVQSDLNTQSFIFEATVNLQAGASGAGIAFVGFGPGEPNAGSFGEPTTSLAVRLAPPDFAGGVANLHLMGAEAEAFGVYGGGRHRVQLVKDGDLLTINLDRDYNGEIFFTDSTYSVDLSATAGLTAANSHLFVGSASYLTTFDDIRLHVIAAPAAVPEPATALMAMPALLLLRRPRRERTRITSRNSEEMACRTGNMEQY